jgi:2,4-dienoyl-CoA reductase (NADPH2)
LLEYAKALVPTGCGRLCVNVGWHEARVPQIVLSVPRGVFAYLARGIRDSGGCAGHRQPPDQRSPTARELIADGMCDMVAMGRSLIADPYLPEKAQPAGKMRCPLHRLRPGVFRSPVRAQIGGVSVQPPGRPGGRNHHRTAHAPKSVMVVGGGAAGMSAALAAAERGHKVTLYDSAMTLGGQLYLAAAPPGRGEFAELARDLATQIGLSPVSVVLNTTVDAKTLTAAAPDAVIVATGARPLAPPIPGRTCPTWSRPGMFSPAGRSPETAWW